MAAMAGVPTEHGRRLGEHCVKRQRAEDAPQQHQAQQEGEVADAIDDEGLAPSARIGRVPVPEADQQVAAQAHQLPAHEQHQEVGPQHQDQHAEHEQVHVGEEATQIRVGAHVANGEDVDEEADSRHHQHHEPRQGVQMVGPIHNEAALAGRPGGHEAVRRWRHFHVGEDAAGRNGRHGSLAHHRRRVPHAAAVDQLAQTRQPVQIHPDLGNGVGRNGPRQLQLAHGDGGLHPVRPHLDPRPQHLRDARQRLTRRLGALGGRGLGRPPAAAAQSPPPPTARTRRPPDR